MVGAVHRGDAEAVARGGGLRGGPRAGPRPHRRRRHRGLPPAKPGAPPSPSSPRVPPHSLSQDMPVDLSWTQTAASRPERAKVAALSDILLCLQPGKLSQIFGPTTRGNKPPPPSDSPAVPRGLLRCFFCRLDSPGAPPPPALCAHPIPPQRGPARDVPATIQTMIGAGMKLWMLARTRTTPD